MRCSKCGMLEEEVGFMLQGSSGNVCDACIHTALLLVDEFTKQLPKNKYVCTNAECIQLHLKEDEDIRLRLHIIEGAHHEYHVKDDGSLELYDSEGTLQEVYFECELCGQRYEFANDNFDLGYIEEKHVLPYIYQELNLRKVEE